MTGDDNGSDYYFGGIYIENGYLTIAGGTVNVTAPAFTTDKHLYTTGISLHSGSFGFVAGSLNIDLSGFGVTLNGSSEWINGCGLQLGDSEDFTHSVKWGVDGGETIINLGDNCATGVQLCANASADLQKGSLTVNGFQGFVNQGLVQLRDGMAITLRPWENQDDSTQHTAGNGMFVNDIHYAARRIASLNMMGGTLTAVGGSEPAMVTQGELTQSGGRIILSTDGGRPAAQFFGKNIITGGSMELTAPIGMHIAPDSHLPQNYLRLAGGELTVNCGFNGVVAMAPMVLQGGSLTINQTDADAQEPSSALLLIDDGSLTVTGGEHVINAAGNPLDMGLRVFGGTKAEFRGGKMTVTGGGGALLGDVLPDETTPTPANPITFTGVFMHEPDSDVEMEFLTYTFRENVNGEDLAILRYTPGARSGDEVTPAAAVVIEPGQGIVKPTVEPTARVEVTTAKPTAGAYITVQATVTADDGVVSFVTNDVSFVPDSITVNGVAYSGDLSNIPVEGSAAIVFRVKSEGYTKGARVDCILTDGDAEINATTGSFTVYDFQMTAPTYTTYDTITVRGAAAPSSDLELKIGEIRTVAIEVTELGTFAKEIELPIHEGQYNAQSFTLTPVLDGVMQAPLTVVYNPTSVRLDFLRITNQVVDSMGTPTSATNEVSFLTGTGMPERSFYTYIPDMNHFDFETEFYVPLGWLITEAWVEVTYMDGEVEKLELEEAGERQVIHNDDSRTEFWVVSRDLDGAPVDFKVVYQVARIKGTVVPVPDPAPYDPKDPDPNYVEEEEERETEELPLLPIIDPSGTIYSGTLDNPIAGATVTLYFGDTKAKPQGQELYDMTPLGQVNPQVTDGSGHYSWDVPTGWWKVVAEKDGYRAESEWVHVLPAHTDLHLNLNMPTAKSGAYDLIRVRPVTINGKIPTGKSEQFSAEVTVTNFTAVESAVLMVAAYGEGGKYLGMQWVEINGLDKGVTTTRTVTLDNANGEAVSLKAFLVKNMADLTPVSAKVEFSNN